MLNLNTTCYTVQNGVIVEGTLRDFERFIEEENTPYGIQRKYFIRCAVVEQFADEIGGRHLEFVSSPAVDDVVCWALMYWQGGSENILFTFFDEKDAIAELERCFAYDILNNNQFFIHLNRQSAENELHDSLEDQAL
jgi:hypothetical protein